MKGKSIWLIAAMACCIGMAAGASAEAAPAPAAGKSAAEPAAAENGVLRVELPSVRVLDIGEDMVTVAADVSVLTDGKWGKTRAAVYRLGQTGRVWERKPGGGWEALPEAEDPAAAGVAEQIRSELGNPLRREEFLLEIQQILLRKGEAGKNSAPDTAMESKTVKNTGAKNQKAPARAAADQDGQKPETAAGKKSDGNRRKMERDEKAKAGTEKKTVKKSPDDRAKETKPEPVIVDIRSHEPQVVIEIHTDNEEQRDAAK